MNNMNIATLTDAPKKVLEKYFDLTEAGVDYTIRQYLANGWCITHTGLTLCIMQKTM